MAQYRIDRHDFRVQDHVNFEVQMLADENGELWNRRYAKDAWNRPKTVMDRSVFSGTWTFGIPTRVWEEYQFDGSVWTPQGTFSRATTVNKMLSVVSGTVSTNGSTLATKQYSRYQPNRGHLYSTAVMMPVAAESGTRRFGLATPDDGVFFELVGDGVDWDLFAGRRSYGTTKSYTSVKAKILELFPGFDPSNGNVYDIQYQWRGVGNYYFYINLQLVHVDEVLGTLTKADGLSMSDPALQPFYSAYCDTDGIEVEILAGCVDVSSEGGQDERTLFGSVNTGDTLLSFSNTVEDIAMLAIHVPRTTDTSFNSRGAIMDKLVTWSRDEALTKVYVFRDTTAPNLTALAWEAIPDSHLLQIKGGNLSALDVAYKADEANGVNILAEWADLEAKNVITNEADNSAFLLTPGDILVVVIHPFSGTGKTGSATLYYSEQI